jgi:hypothetical protein
MYIAVFLSIRIPHWILRLSSLLKLRISYRQRIMDVSSLINVSMDKIVN